MHKSVVITGSSRGIGFGLAERFLETGCSVMVNGSTDASSARALEKLRRYGNRAAAHAADVSHPEGVAALFKALRAPFSRRDLFSRGAGGLPE